MTNTDCEEHQSPSNNQALMFWFSCTQILIIIYLITLVAAHGHLF